MSCNPIFFNQGGVSASDEAKTLVQAGHADKYRSLLKQYEPAINSVFLNEAQPEDIPVQFYSDLSKLVSNERLRTAGHLPKGFDLNTLIKEAKVEESANIEGFFSKRTIGHLTRLIFPYEYESFTEPYSDLKDKFQYGISSKFGKDLISYLSKNRSKEEMGKLEYVMGGEGDGVVLLWTLLPYIHLDLEQRKNSANESISKIADWIIDASERVIEKGISKDNLPVFGIFKHVESYHFGDSFDIWIKFKNPLGYTEKGPSHLRTRLISKAISREL